MDKSMVPMQNLIQIISRIYLPVKWSLVLFIIYFLSYKLLKRRKLIRELSWLSGPETLPVLGNALSLYGLKTSEIPILLKSWSEKYGTAFIYWVGLDPVINIQEPYLFQVLSNTGKEAKKSVEYKFLSSYCGDSLLTSSGDVWWRKRRLITPCFHYEILDSFLDTMNKHAKHLVEITQLYADQGQTFDFFSKAKLATLDVLMETSMGSNVNALENEDDPYVQAIAKMREMVMTRSLSVMYRSDFLFNLTSKKKEEDTAAAVLKRYVTKIIKLRKEKRQNRDADRPQLKSKKKKALLDMLLDLNDAGDQIDDKELQDEVNTFIFAGHDTASVAISYTIYLMAKHPRIQERVYNELQEILPNLAEDGLTQNDLNRLEYLDRCVKESLRMFPPVPLIGKILPRPLVTEKGLIPAGVNITENIYNLHNNAEYFPDPQVYDPDRFLPDNASQRNPYAFLPFGSGFRNCIGQRFALNEVKTILSHMIFNYEISTEQDLDDLKIGFDIVLTPTKGVYIKLKKRKSV